MIEAVLLDNDVVLKTCCYANIDEIDCWIEEVEGPIFVLGVARYVISKRIARSRNIADKEGASQTLKQLLNKILELEPDGDEMALAAEFETEAQARGVALDSGESLLFAILIRRCGTLMLTGDKRAIHAIEVITQSLSLAPGATGRVACLEQLVFTLLNRCGADQLRQRICREPAIDRALAVCFSCSACTSIQAQAVEGLVSYIAEIRRNAPNVLVPSDDLSTVIA